MNKFFLCKRQFNSGDLLKQHYIDFHNVNSGKYFFKKLFAETRSNINPGECLRCDEFVLTLKAPKLHNFLKLYLEGKTTAFEDRPLNTYKIGSIKIFEINVQEHSRYYDFGEPDNVVSNFLTNVRRKFVPTEEVAVKCGFSLKNIQPALYGRRAPIINKRYWTTDAYITVHFYDYLFHNLEIKKYI